MAFYRRRLPHWQPEGKSLFLTWSLRGSLPHDRFPPPESLSAGKAFVWMDRRLDEARSGPTWLKRPEIAQIVVDALRYGSDTLGHYDLHAYVVMPNHVHVLFDSLGPTPSKLLQSVKGFSAREANKILARTGEPFWQTGVLRPLGAGRDRVSADPQIYRGKSGSGRFGRRTGGVFVVEVFVGAGP